MIRIASLSEHTRCDILIKCEFANPGGSVKDRVALKIITEALESGELKPGGIVTEGTAGSTGVSIAMVANAIGVTSKLSLPDDAAAEKTQLMRAFGATVEPVRPVSITHSDHFVNVARRRAKEAVETNGDGGGVFADQFENLANARAHFEGTGPEIWEQVKGLGVVGGITVEGMDMRKKTANTRSNPNATSSSSMGKHPRYVDAFICACGTGGTLAGVALFLKKMDSRIKCFLVDPQGSSLYNKVTRGVLYTHHEAEGKRLRNPFDTITEGVGINRLTRNFSVALGDEKLFDEKVGNKLKPQVAHIDKSYISGAFRASDREAVEMSRYLARTDGLFLGSSSCVNIVGATKLALSLGPGHRVVTIACDGGGRHLSKFWSNEYLEKHGLAPVSEGLEFLET